MSIESDQPAAARQAAGREAGASVAPASDASAAGTARPQPVPTRSGGAARSGPRRGGARRRRVAGGRSIPVTVKFSDDEYGALRVRAAASGLTPAAFLASAAEAVSGRLGAGGMPAEERRAWAGELMATRRLLAATGNNLNQLARAANSGARVDPTVAATTVRACERAVHRASEVLDHLHSGRS